MLLTYCPCKNRAEVHITSIKLCIINFILPIFKVFLTIEKTSFFTAVISFFVSSNGESSDF